MPQAMQLGAVMRWLLVLAVMVPACGDARAAKSECRRSDRSAGVLAQFVARTGDCERPAGELHLGEAPPGCEPVVTHWSDDECSLAASFRCPTHEGKHSTTLDPEAGTFTGVYTEWGGDCSGSWDVTAKRQ